MALPTPEVPAGANSNAVYRTAFQDWIAGAGAKFRFQKHVLKPKQSQSTGVPVKHALLLIALLVIAPSVAAGKRAPSNVPVVSAATAHFILVGTVTEIDKDPIETSSGPETKDKVAYTVATVKVTDAIRGLKTETHIKIGMQPNTRFGPQLLEKQEYLLFLTKHHSGNFYLLNWMNPPLAITETTKGSVDEVKAIGKVLADPTKALKAEKAEERAVAAVALILHYRTPSDTGVLQTTEALPLDESQAILKAYGGVDWSAAPQLGGFGMLRQFYSLGLNAEAGWTAPAIKPGDNATVVFQKAYTDWLAGPGAKYRIQKFVAKKK